MSILEIPDYIKKRYKRHILGVSIDYKRFNIRDRKLMDSLLLSAHKANNETNSNVAYDGEVAFVRVWSPRWVAHKVVMSVENIWPVPFCYVEIYWLGQGLKWSIAKIDFYGAFFHFIDIVPKRYLDLYTYLQDLSIQETQKVKVTRIDVAIDVARAFPQNQGNWIKPCENSKREVQMYKHKGLFNSYWYLSDKNRWYGVRLYNKIVDIEKNWKQNWYWWSEKLPKNWTRIEYEFYDPYTKWNDDDLMRICAEKVLWDGQVSLWLKFRPCFDFKIELAYWYFERYAKSHGISMERLIKDIKDYHEKMIELNWQNT